MALYSLHDDCCTLIEHCGPSAYEVLLRQKTDPDGQVAYTIDCIRERLICAARFERLRDKMPALLPETPPRDILRGLPSYSLKTYWQVFHAARAQHPYPFVPEVAEALAATYDAMRKLLRQLEDGCAHAQPWEYRELTQPVQLDEPTHRAQKGWALFTMRVVQDILSGKDTPDIPACRLR